MRSKRATTHPRRRVLRGAALAIASVLAVTASCAAKRPKPRPALSPAAFPASAAAPASPESPASAEPTGPGGPAPATPAAERMALERHDDLVDITELDRTIVIDMRYASAGNFTGVAVYPVARCLLRRSVAARLIRVQAALSRRGLGLKLWDCYRPLSVQARFWELVPDARYVARPVYEGGVAVGGSRHNRGAAVDITLVSAGGRELEMPSFHDDFSARAHRDYAGASAEAMRNARLLEDAMVAEGFLPLSTEWWHFDSPDWQNYPLADTPLE